PAHAVGHETAFEVDHIDDAFSRGWSVLVVGAADALTEPREVAVLENEAGTVTPWAGGERDLWVVVTAGR
ncbi:pyridoxamine 5'-phosphate oxidase family protein, partial [Methylobacterium frigidaeris]|uniref:pyridoxamine 5'-phosphate oxidase family protein n=1 Tax=Methylobacterium frigidaeris TaxID=2038277 RepID=UPI001EDD0681